MIEMTVHDVMVRVPKNEEVQWPGRRRDFRKFGSTMLVVLKEREGERMLPMFVGLGAGTALAMQLADVETPRPMTFDLMARLLEASANQIHQVAVTRLHEHTFYATVWIRAGDRLAEVDARPSDALNLALRVQAPILVAPEVLEQAGQSPDRVLPEMEAKYPGDDPSEETAMELRSFRTLPWEEGIGWSKPPKQ